MKEPYYISLSRRGQHVSSTAPSIIIIILYTSLIGWNNVYISIAADEVGIFDQTITSLGVTYFLEEEKVASFIITLTEDTILRLISETAPRVFVAMDYQSISQQISL